MVGNRGNDDLRLNRWDAGNRSANDFGTVLKLPLHAFVGLREQPIDCGDHADNLLLGDFHPSADAFVERIVGESGGRNQIFSTE